MDASFRWHDGVGGSVYFFMNLSKPGGRLNGWLPPGRPGRPAGGAAPAPGLPGGNQPFNLPPGFDKFIKK